MWMLAQTYTSSFTITFFEERRNTPVRTSLVGLLDFVWDAECQIKTIPDRDIHLDPTTNRTGTRNPFPLYHSHYRHPTNLWIDAGIADPQPTHTPATDIEAEGERSDAGKRGSEVLRHGRKRHGRQRHGRKYARENDVLFLKTIRFLITHLTWRRSVSCAISPRKPSLSATEHGNA